MFPEFKEKSDKEVNRVPLTGKLEEFRMALEEEIRTARTNAYGQAASLISGRKISQISGGYQYSFRLKNALNLPADSPGDLQIPNRKPVDITIISVDGLSTIISSREDLGDYVAQALLVSDLTFLMRKLIERIEELANLENKVGDRILNNDFQNEESKSIDFSIIANENPPNEKQQEALNLSLNNNLTYVWGPPGTGKTRTIGLICCQLQINQRSVLIVSHTNTAVDQALLNIAQQTSPELIEQGKILRVGEIKDQRLSKDYPEILLETHVNRRSKELSNRLTSLKDELAASEVKAQKLANDIELYDWFQEAKNDLEKMRSDNDELVNMELELTEHRKLYVELRGQLSYWDEANERAKDVSRKIIQFNQLDIRISEIDEELRESLSDRGEIYSNLLKANKILNETSSVNRITRSWRRLPSPEHQEKIVGGIENQLRKTEKRKDQITDELNSQVTNRNRLKEEISRFREDYSTEPDEILAKEKVYQVQRLQVVQEGKALRNETNRHRARLSTTLRERLVFLQELGYIEPDFGTAEEMFIQIDKTFQRIERLVILIKIADCRLMIGEELEKLEKTRVKILHIEELLSRIEETVIAEADIVATTLTRAYLRDTIRSRKYDTIIIDEASMAPIPAIWVASSLVENNAVIVGDPKQLPPIVTSSHEMAEKWLGKDVFSISGVMVAKPENLIQLREQYRMHPEITAIPNHFFIPLMNN